MWFRILAIGMLTTGIVCFLLAAYVVVSTLSEACAR